MRLYLTQHARAFSEMEDPERSITPQGKEETICTATWLKDRDIRVDRIWHSRKKRAVETAEIIADSIGPVKLEEKDGLSPDDPVEIFETRFIGSSDDIMIVGHMPFLSKLVSLLLSGDEKKSIISFRNSGVVCLERIENWALSWAIDPKLMV